jgi:hypothetical protein
MKLTTPAISPSLNLKQLRALEADCRKYSQTLKQKYRVCIESRTDQVCPNCEWIYSWLFVDLREWELADRNKHGIHYMSKKEIMLSTDDSILRTRERLGYLQTQMVRNI